MKDKQSKLRRGEEISNWIARTSSGIILQRVGKDARQQGIDDR